MIKKGSNKQYLELWQDYRDNILKATPVDLSESYSDQQKRIKKLESDPGKWFKYYFPNFCFAEPADFHKKSTNRILSNPEWYEVKPWSRELAKSVTTMMEVLNLTLTGKKKNVILTSNSADNAERLLLPYKTNLEVNQRIIHDYGDQVKFGSWEAKEFVTRKGVSFRAIGAGQSPRGTRNDESRPDVILIDDIDTDEDCRNPETIEIRWNWIEQALIGTRSVSVPLLVIFCGNIIAEDCCITRAIKKADYAKVVNIRDENGVSTWAKNTEEMIDRVLSMVSYESQQKEYYNNPISAGKVFPEMIYGKCPPLSKLDFVVIYSDPSTSNNDKPGVRSKAQNSCKAVVIVGSSNLKFYVYKAWVDTTTNANFIDWLYAAFQETRTKTQPYIFIENNTLQDPFYQQVFLPLIHSKGKEFGTVLPIRPDDRKKPDKYFRIEGTLEPLNRMGMLILNESEKGNPNMERLEAQFKAVKPGSKTMDGPDAVEGAVHIIQSKIASMTVGKISVVKRKQNKKRY